MCIARILFGGNWRFCDGTTLYKAVNKQEVLYQVTVVCFHIHSMSVLRFIDCVFWIKCVTQLGRLGVDEIWASLSNRTTTEIRIWIDDFILMKLLDVITHPRPNFNGGLFKPPWKLGHGWIITSHMERLFNYESMLWFNLITLSKTDSTISPLR